MKQEPGQSSANEICELKKMLENESSRRMEAEEELQILKIQLGKHSQTDVNLN